MGMRRRSSPHAFQTLLAIRIRIALSSATKVAAAHQASNITMGTSVRNSLGHLVQTAM